MERQVMGTGSTEQRRPIVCLNGGRVLWLFCPITRHDQNSRVQCQWFASAGQVTAGGAISPGALRRCRSDAGGCLSQVVALQAAAIPINGYLAEWLRKQ